MTVNNISDPNATIGIDSSYLFIQYCGMIQFAQDCPLILPSPFSVIMMINSTSRLRY